MNITELIGLPELYQKLLLSKGIDGFLTLDKFGENDDVQNVGDVIWDFGGQYTFSTTAAIDTLSSSEAGDTQTIEIQGLDFNTWELVNQTITLSGQSQVNLTTPLIRVFRMKNENSIDNAGTIYCYENSTATNGVPDDGSKVRAIISPGQNQSLMSVYSVPAGYDLYITSTYATMTRQRAAAVDFSIRVREFDGVFQIKRKYGINSQGAGWSKDYEPFLRVSEKSDIIMQVDYFSNNNFGVASGFSGYLLKK